ncbi:Hpt domain-containing protein [Ruminococcus sp.]|uniref:Hpt domain-containing protein n=1 Tax=Ruminococcus sp. TaxID=41978 RepID=UPI0038911918
MITIEKLNEFGADTKEGLGRCYGNEALYLRLVGMIPAEANFEKLSQALNAGDLDAAFEAAHALKGVLGNLSLTPMYETCSELTELLRARTDTDCTSLLNTLTEQRERLRALCAA